MLKTAAIFRDGMVLQQQSEVAVFGQSDCEKIEVNFDGECVVTKPQNGEWLVKIHTKQAAKISDTTVDSKAFELVVTGISADDEKEQLVFKDIVLGEVWLAGGQSNMELELQNSDNGARVVKEADYDFIRFYNVPKCPAVDDNLFNAEKNTTWKRVKESNPSDMSAVAYYFAKKLYEELQIPIGIIDCYWGGTSATCWVDRESLKDVSEAKSYIDEWDMICDSKTDEQYDKELNEYNASFDSWWGRCEKYRKENPDMEWNEINKLAGECPWPPPRGRKSPFRPFGLYESMVKRIIPYTIKGIIYYQAEEDCDRADYYSKLNTAVIKRWRNDFTVSDSNNIPFYITQLPMYIAKDVEDDKKWCILRQQQELCAKINENVGIASIIDCGEYDNIHPTDKETPGTRLAQRVLSDTYEQGGLKNLTLAKAIFDGDKCVLEFDGTYGELAYKKTDGILLTARVNEIVPFKDAKANNDEVYGFEISSNGGLFYKPQVIADGDRLILKGNENEDITEVRYGWFSYGVANIYSKELMPLMPFKVNNKG